MMAFILGMAGSALIVIIYGFFFAQKEDRIRQYLSARKKGWARKRYIRAFVGAVRGRAAATETAFLVFLVLLVPYGASLALWGVALSLESGIERLDERIQLSSCNSNAGDKDNCKSVIEKQTATIQESIKLRPIALRIVLAGRIAAVLLFLSFYVGLFFWRPFIIMRRRFAFEIERFTLRIQGLASKPELAELAVAEAHVTNENTLRAFVEITRKVAIRHGIPQLVTTFDLWRENQKDSSSLKD